jgi:hypothetical protein
MAEYQPKYNKEIGLVGKTQIPFIKDQINRLRTAMNAPGVDPKMKEAMQHRINAFNIQIQSINKGKPITPIEEDINEGKGGFATTKQKWIDKIANGNEEKAYEVETFIHNTVKALEKTNKGDYRYIVGTLKKILFEKYKISLNEDGEGGVAITTTSVGTPSMSTSDGGVVPAIYGDSSKAIKSTLGTFGRRNFYPPKNGVKKSSKKKSKGSSNPNTVGFIDHYYDKNP